MDAPAPFGRAGFVLIVLLALAGCASGRPLMPTPVLYTLAQFEPFGHFADTLQTTDIDVLYVTDRRPETAEDGRLSYGIGRSHSVAFGAARVNITSKAYWDDLTAPRVDITSDAYWDELMAPRADMTGNVSWNDLIFDARVAQRTRPLELTLVQAEELGRAPPQPIPWKQVDGVVMPDPDIVEIQRQVVEVFHAELVKRLALTDRKEVFLYVHGIQNSFADAIFAMSEIWHFLGREGVPIAYTWPAGGGGLLRGYTRDRESGEFTVFHLKNIIRVLTSFPEVEALHIIAHSRGTDITVTALRELLIEIRARNENPQEVLKIHNVVLASPDLDLSVTLQRATSERLGSGVRRATIYTSPHDKAISMAEFLFGGLIRLGQLDLLHIGDDLKRATASVGANIAIIEYTGTRSGSFGHSYFRVNPAVASDLILTLRYDRDPGAENGRPLKRVGEIYWQIDDDYLANLGSPRRQ